MRNTLAGDLLRDCKGGLPHGSGSAEQLEPRGENWWWSGGEGFGGGGGLPPPLVSETSSTHMSGASGDWEGWRRGLPIDGRHGIGPPLCGGATPRVSRIHLSRGRETRGKERSPPIPPIGGGGRGEGSWRGCLEWPRMEMGAPTYWPRGGTFESLERQSLRGRVPRIGTPSALALMGSCGEPASPNSQIGGGDDGADGNWRWTMGIGVGDSPPPSGTIGDSKEPQSKQMGEERGGGLLKIRPLPLQFPCSSLAETLMSYKRGRKTAENASGSDAPQVVLPQFLSQSAPGADGGAGEVVPQIGEPPPAGKFCPQNDQPKAQIFGGGLPPKSCAFCCWPFRPIGELTGRRGGMASDSGRHAASLGLVERSEGRAPSERRAELGRGRGGGQ